MNEYRLEIYGSVQHPDRYDIPFIKRTNIKLNDKTTLVGFNEVRSKSNIRGSGVHFFIDDYQFERVWNEPKKYVDMIKECNFALSPDFSLFTDMPLCQQIHNTYRNRLVGYYMQKRGIAVIPTVGWSDERSYDFCFCGVEQESTVAVSNIGCWNDDRAKTLWYAGYEEMIKRLNPKSILLYGTPINNQGEIVTAIGNSNIKRLREHGR